MDIFMGVLFVVVLVVVFFGLPFAIVVIPLKLSVRRCGLKYFIVDTVITGFVFVYGSIFLWAMSIPGNIPAFWIYFYIPLRFIIILVHSIRMEKNIISHNSAKAKRLIIINIVINIFAFIGTARHFYLHISHM